MQKEEKIDSRILNSHRCFFFLSLLLWAPRLGGPETKSYVLLLDTFVSAYDTAVKSCINHSSSSGFFFFGVCSCELHNAQCTQSCPGLVRAELITASPSQPGLMPE